MQAVPPGEACPACLMRLGLAAAMPADDDESLVEIRERFPEFDIQRVLGQGGMGTVYLARHVALDRLVAIKVIRGPLAEDAGFAERFTREARTLARLNHPQIVSVHDFGEREGLCFLVMEYVDGSSLRERMREGRMSPEGALAIIPRICEALQYAHDQGVVHRDIKPENILLDRQGRVKIADFGLAKMAAASDSPPSLTLTRQVVGTPQYMAPEQMQGSKRVDHRADIYSLGVVFYELLTGELPLGRFEPPSHHGAVDSRLDPVVLRSLERDPERRYQRAAQLQSEIESLGGAAAVGGAPIPAVERESARAADKKAFVNSGKRASRAAAEEERLRSKDIFASGVLLVVLGGTQASIGVYVILSMFAPRPMSHVSLAIIPAILMLAASLLMPAIGIAKIVCGFRTLLYYDLRAVRWGAFLLLIPSSPEYIVHFIVAQIILRLIPPQTDASSGIAIDRASPAYASTMTLPVRSNRKRWIMLAAGLALVVFVVFPMWRQFANTRMLAAMQRSDAISVRSWGTWGASAQVVDDQQTPALFLAARAGDGAVVDSLLWLGASVDSPTPAGETPLMAAAFAGHQDVCDRLLERKAEVNRRSHEGATALHFAIRGGHERLAEELLQAGASPTAADNSGRTPLHWAAVDGRSTIVGRLLERDAFVDPVAVDGDTPLIKAAWKGHAPVVERLLYANAAVERVNSNDETPLLLAAASGSEHCVKKLLEFKANTRHTSKAELTALVIAAAKGHVGIVDILLQARMPKPESTEALTAMRMASSAGHDDVVERLATAGIAEPPSSFFRRGYLLAREGRYASATPLLEKSREMLSDDPPEWRFTSNEWTYVIARPKVSLPAFIADCQRLAGDQDTARKELRELAEREKSPGRFLPLVSRWTQAQEGSTHRSYGVSQAELDQHVEQPDQPWDVTVRFQDVDRGAYSRTRGESGTRSETIPNLFP